MGKIYVSTTSFVTSVEGVCVRVKVGDTVREGHPLLAEHSAYFVALKPKFEHTPPPAPEPKPEPKPESKPALKLPEPKKAEEKQAKVEEKQEG